MDYARVEVDESRFWDLGESKDIVIEIDKVAKHAIHQGVVVSIEIKDNIEVERIDLDTHENTTVLDRNCCIVNNSGKMSGVYPSSPEHQVLKVLILDAVTQHDGPYSGKICMLACK